MRSRKQGQAYPTTFPIPAPVAFESVIPNPKLKLLDQLREVMRLKHYSIRTETAYGDWIRRYVKEGCSTAAGCV